MARMTGGQALARSLYQEGVRMVFGLPGLQTYHATDALYGQPGMRFISTRHEQATTYMADGYARAGRTIGCAMVVPGPGLQNASAGIGTAFAASSPILVIAAQINRDNIGKNVGIIHEVNDQLDTIRPVTKWSCRVLNAVDIPYAVQEAFRQLRTGRPRPVEIEMPPEALAETADIDIYERRESLQTPGDAGVIEQAAELLQKAAKPVIWAGGGVHSSRAWQELLQMAEYLQAPVITTVEGKGAISDRHYLSLGVFRGSAARGPARDVLRDYFKNCDVTLAVGTRFATAGPPKYQRVIQIDVDPEEIGRNHQNTLGVVGDARLSLIGLLACLRELGPPKPSQKAQFEAARLERYDPSKQLEPFASYVRAIRESLPDDGILVPDMTQIAYYSRAFYPVYEPLTYLTTSYYLNLGAAYPIALGAKVAQPNRAVIALCGDGGFQFNIQEIATAIQYKINVIAIVFNDSAYGNVLRDQQELFNGRVIGSELINPDFMKLADAYGAMGMRAHGPAELGTMLRQAIESDRPALIEVPIGQLPRPF